MGHAFHQGGWGMYPTSIAGLVLVALAVQFARDPDRGRLRVVKSLSITTLLVGTLGFVVGCIKCFTSIGSFEGADPGTMALIGVGEAANCLGLALVTLVMAGIAVTIGASRARRGTPKPAGGRADLTDPLAP